MLLLYRNMDLGSISDVGGEQPWWIGNLTPSSEAEAFREFFAWMVDEDRNSAADEPPFDRAWWTDENWYIQDDDGNRRGIDVPAVHGDGQIWWRWR